MEELFQQLKPSGVMRTIPKGGNVLFQGEIPRNVVIVRDGIVRAYTITTSGEERTVALHGKNDIIPLSWALGTTNNTLFYYEAVSDVRLLQVPRSVFTKALDASAELTKAVLAYTTNDYTGLLLRITGLEQSRAAEKIGFTLYYLLFTHGRETKPGEYDIDIRLNHTLFASLVGLSRESTAKNLKQLRDKKVIDYASFHYTVNKARLEAFLGEDSFRDLTI